MPTLHNGPSSQTVLCLQARKSFSLGLWIKDSNERPLDITGSQITMVVRKKVAVDTVDDTANLVANSIADLIDPLGGFAKFELQASDLDQKPGEYFFTVTMIADGFSAVIVSGIIDLQENMEFDSLSSEYVGGSSQNLAVLMQNRHTIVVKTGSNLAPGTTNFTDSDKEKLDGIEAGAEVNVNADWFASGDDAEIYNKPDTLIPPGGARGSILIKRTSSEQDAVWAQPLLNDAGETEGWVYPATDTYPGGTIFPVIVNGLDATGVPNGWVPVANGLDFWDWEPIPAPVTSVNGAVGVVILTADSIGDGLINVTMTQAERLKLANFSTTPSYNDLTDLPTLGTAASRNVGTDATDLIERGEINASTDFLSGTVPTARLPRVMTMNGISYGTASPSGGVDGDIYFQYT